MSFVKRGFYLLTIAFFLLIVYQGTNLKNFAITTHYQWFSNSDLQVQNKLYESYLIHTQGCRILSYDPFDESVIQFFTQRKEPYQCRGRPSFFIIKPNGSVGINQTILDNHNQFITVDLSLCVYRPIRRYKGKKYRKQEDVVVLKPPKILPIDTPLNEDHIAIACFKGKNALFDEYLSFVRIKPDVEKRCDDYDRLNLSLTKNKLNVMYVGVDSISKLNFLRHFPKTRKFLNETLKPIELYGYSKVGDNTFPNIVPMLTGHKYEHYYNESMRRKMFFDHLDFIWKHYAKRGYRTLFSEDAPSIATFNYMRRGFNNPPTDYYTRPFSVAAEDSGMMKISKYHCFDNKMEIEVYFDYLRRFAETMAHRRYFSFTFIARLTHDELNNAGYADFQTYQLLKDLHQKNVLNNTVLLFFSDHGIRFGDIRRTFIGKIEERMPFMFLYFPPWFYESYPEIAQNLRINERRLTTPFDIHATILNLLKLMEPVEESLKSPHGLSLFNQIPENRTCEDASIPFSWCTCNNFTKLSVDNSIAVRASKEIVLELNKLLSHLSKYCAVLELTKIYSAEISGVKNISEFMGHSKEYFSNDSSIYYTVTIETMPSKALFEATVEHRLLSDTWKVEGSISRINRYGTQSRCIADPELRKYCYCNTKKG